MSHRRTPHEVSTPLLVWVAAGHVIALLLLLSMSFVWKTEKPAPPIEIVDLRGGAPVQKKVEPAPKLDRAQVSPKKVERPVQEVKRKVTKPTPPKIQPKKVQKAPPKKLREVAKAPKKVEKKKSAPSKPKTVAKKHVVQVNKQVTASTTRVKTSPSTSQSSKTDIRSSLASALPKLEFTGPGTSQVPDSFKALLKRVLERNWKMPGDVDGSDYTVVWVTVRADGTIVPGSKVASSGHAGMDQTVLAAVRAAKHLGRSLPDGVGNPDFRAKVRFEP